MSPPLSLLLFLLVLSTWAAAVQVPLLGTLDCSSLPSAPTTAQGATWAHSAEDGRPGDLTAVGLSEKWCASYNANPDEGLALHTCSYAHDPQWIFNTSAGNNHIVLQASGACLVLGADGVSLSLADCSAAGARAQFLFDAARHVIQSVGDASRCVSWGKPEGPSAGRYLVRTKSRQQTIWGFGFEVQSDSIGSGNQGLPKSNSSVPHDLLPDQRASFFKEIASGFRFCRLALGLFLRGLDPTQKYIRGRWPTQMSELKEMQDASGLEGFAPEYWSPPPYWKSNKDYIGGTLAAFNDSFLQDFADARVADVQYLQQNGLKVPWWGLQNEPYFSKDDNSAPANDGYSTCHYTEDSYYQAFAKVAPAIKKAFPGIKIHANSAVGQAGCRQIREDAATAALVDAWTWHYVGRDSDSVIDDLDELTNNTLGKPVFNNEFEYQPSSQFSHNYTTINTVQMILNFLALVNSPTFYWIHISKPTTNIESLGYGLTWWRPWDDNNSSMPDLPKGHWKVNEYNWPALEGFVKYMPWDSIRYSVDEQTLLKDNRILAFKTPNTTLTGGGGPRHAFKTAPNSWGVIVTNRKQLDAFTYEIGFDDGVAHTLKRHRYGPGLVDAAAGTVHVPAGKTVNATLPPLTAEFWLEYA